MHQLKTTFEELFPLLSPHGVYLVEDLHTCYWEEYGGGLGRPESFIEYSKGLIDVLNSSYLRDYRLSVNGFTLSTWSMSFYDSILVFEKRPKETPYAKMTGTPSW